MFHNLELQEGAYLISDAHYSHRRPELLELLKKIHSQELLPTQLILMGDIFDALFGGVSSTYKENQEMLQLLQEINERIEVIYLEGNHDFNLKYLLSRMKIFPISSQPLLCSFQEKKVALAHGDFDAPLGYKLYTIVIRNNIVLRVLNCIDRLLGDKIIQKIDRYLAQKDDCKALHNFREHIEQRGLKKYGVDYFIEGHYHQNRSFSLQGFCYINLGAFACNQRYFIVKSSQDNELIIEESHQGD